MASLLLKAHRLPFSRRKHGILVYTEGAENLPSMMQGILEEVAQNVQLWLQCH